METIQIPVKGRKAVMTLATSYILISVCASASGQILLKQGMNRTGAITLNAGQLFDVLWRIGTNPWVVGGLVLYLCGTLFWLGALSRVELSYAYPFASLSYVLMLVASWQLFGENISPLRLMGTLIIAVGVIVVSRS